MVGRLLSQSSTLSIHQSIKELRPLIRNLTTVKAQPQLKERKIFRQNPMRSMDKQLLYDGQIKCLLL